ncbi:MAG: hypothetical protein E6R04_06735 [Spirochaetes bacterium]|nr:MAG: hypothetical protein E6R04_06735 [Spirochaetota bacterium]
MAVVSGLAAAVGLAIYALMPYYTTQVWWEIRSSLFWTVPLIIAIAFGLLGMVLWEEDMEELAVIFGLGCAAAVVTLIGFSCVFHQYIQDQEYAKSITVSNDPMPDMNIRTPYSVAQAQSRTTLSNIPGADLIDKSTRFDQHGDKFTTLAKGRDLLGNYAAVAVQHFPLTGRSKGTQCVFSDNARHILGGDFNHNLGRLINEKQRGVNWSESDAYGLCTDEGTPLVVVPLKKQVGWAVVTEVPAGVAIYNGRTDEVSIETDTSKLEGATYPLSLAARQRESSKALGGVWQYLRSQIGWRPAEGEVNSANSREFVLGGKDGRMRYITPLSNQGNSTGIAAVSVLDADDEQYGQRSELVVHVTDPTWVSVEAVEARIKADYQDIPNWQTIAVQEVVPVGPNRWVATLGNDQNTQYRVEGTGDLSPIPGAYNEAVTCLYQGTDKSPRRCGTLALVAGNGIGAQYGPSESAAAPPSAKAPSTSVSTMSDQELAALLRQIADEISRRGGR